MPGKCSQQPDPDAQLNVRILSSISERGTRGLPDQIVGKILSELCAAAVLRAQFPSQNRLEIRFSEVERLPAAP
jgi:hypothetical protein